MTTRYRIELSPPWSARDSLARIGRDSLQLEADASARFWAPEEGVPIRPAGVFRISLELGEERRAVGSVGVWAREFLVDGRSVRAALLAHLFLDRRYRGALPAIRLVREARRYVLDRFEFAYGFPREGAAGVLRRCGYRPCGEMVRYVRLLRHPSRRTGAAIAGYRIEWLTDADERIDTLWDRAAAQYRVIGRRNAAFVERRLLKPSRQCRLATLVSRRTRQVRAYAATELRERVARVRDFFGHPQDLAPLFELVSRDARRAGAGILQVKFLGDPRTVAALRAAGFRPRPPPRGAIVEPDADRCVVDPSCWFATAADEEGA